MVLSHRERKNARPSQRREVLVSKVGQTTTSHEVKSLTPNNHPRSVVRQSQCHVKSRDVRYTTAKFEPEIATQLLELHH